MYPSVRNAFPTFSTTFEGRISYMYLDIKGFVTTGVGNLIDPVSLALPLPFVHKSDLSTATQDEIQTDWQAVKGRPDLATVKDYLKQFDDLTALKLTDDSIDQLMLSKLDSNVTTLMSTTEFADLESWPADAQLGLFSMAWAMGAAFGPGFPSFRAACAAKDWNTAATESRMNDADNPGLTQRNTANHTLFSNAAQVVAQGLDFTVLQYPNDLASGAPASTTQTVPFAPPVITALDPSSGKEGDTVTITGSNFTGATSVGFGDVSISNMSVDSDTQITVVVPSGSGNVPVTVITTVGSSEPSPSAEFAYSS